MFDVQSSHCSGQAEFHTRCQVSGFSVQHLTWMDFGTIHFDSYFLKKNLTPDTFF